jgi:ribosomal protein S18 acetylase RimI-like enzyme
MIMRISGFTGKHLLAVARLLNEEYRGSYGFIQFDRERILSEIRRRDLKVLVAEEDDKALGLIATHVHAEENFEQHVTWLAAEKGPDNKLIEDILVDEIEKNAEGRAVIVMVDVGSPRIDNWVNRGYVLCPGFQEMSAKLDGLRPVPEVAEGIRLRNLTANEEEELIATINDGFGWQRLGAGALDAWKSNDPPFNENWVQVAEADGRIVSAVVARPDTEYVKYLCLKRGHLGPAATLPEFRSKHLASALTAKAMNFLYEKGMDSVRLGTSEQNVSSIALLRNLGFQVDIVRKTLRKELNAKL